MFADRPIWIVGAGGLARGMVDALRLQRRSIGGLVVQPGVDAGWFTGDTIGEDATGTIPGPFEFAVAIGDNARRKAISARMAASRPDAGVATVIHPSAVIARSASLGEGSIVLGSVNVGPAAAIGAHVLLYTGTIVEHDCQIADFASTGPGAILGGGVRVGETSFIGLGARVAHGRTIGADSVIGMGASVIRDIPDRVVAVGSPARAIRARKPGEPYL